MTLISPLGPQGASLQPLTGSRGPATKSAFLPNAPEKQPKDTLDDTASAETRSTLSQRWAAISRSVSVTRPLWKSLKIRN